MNNVQKSTLKIPKKKIDDNVIVSNIFRIKKDKDKIELPEKPDNNQSPSQNKQINNWNIKSFMPRKTNNQLDDLQQLLKQSEKYKQTMQFLETHPNKRFTDTMFKADYNSLIGFPQNQRQFGARARGYIWLRPDQFSRRHVYNKVYGEIESNDIMQGELGDCYFLAAISSIAQVPERLERIFLIKKMVPQGIYVVALCINGIWEDVIIDDKFPCLRQTKGPAFSYSKGGELWVMILEKAWAKIHGGYYNINAGIIREALRDLTGASAKTFFTQDHSPQENWNILSEAFEKKFILTAGSDDLNNGSDAYISHIGICGAHAYTIMGVYSVARERGGYRLVHNTQSRSSNVERIIKLRNPWGKKEWKGDWSD